MKIERVGVLGLGYVGLPLAVALAREFDVVGYDISESRVAALTGGHDHSGEVADDDLGRVDIAFTTDAAALAGRDWTPT